MADALLAWELGEGAGHCANLRSVAKVLLEQGLSVQVAAQNTQTALAVFRDLDVAITPAPPAADGGIAPGQRLFSYAQVLHDAGYGDDARLERQVAQWREVLESCAPRVIVSEHAPTALLASRWYDYRRVVASGGFCIPPDVSPLPLFGDPSPLEREIALAEEADVLAAINRLLSRDGLPPLARLSQLNAEVDETLLFTLPELDHYPQRKAGQYCLPESPPFGAKPDWPPGTGQRVFCYLKPTESFRHCRPLLGALSAAGLRVLAYVPGSDSDRADLRSDDYAISDTPIDLDWAATKCSFAVTNGGAGISAQLFARGLPQLVVPIYTEQLLTGRAIERHGAGRVALASDPQSVVTGIAAMIQDRSSRMKGGKTSRTMEHATEQALTAVLKVT